MEGLTLLEKKAIWGSALGWAGKLIGGGAAKTGAKAVANAGANTAKNTLYRGQTRIMSKNMFGKIKSSPTSYSSGLRMEIASKNAAAKAAAEAAAKANTATGVAGRATNTAVNTPGIVGSTASGLGTVAGGAVKAGGAIVDGTIGAMKLGRKAFGALNAPQSFNQALGWTIGPMAVMKGVETFSGSGAKATPGLTNVIRGAV
jgi:hypothetical protein